ncbi:CBF1 interacting corepressor [Microdochium nivale]|nr:CBF1 interacting corepressor [Microdochium nivale]
MAKEIAVCKARANMQVQYADFSNVQYFQQPLDSEDEREAARIEKERLEYEQEQAQIGGGGEDALDGAPQEEPALSKVSKKSKKKAAKAAKAAATNAVDEAMENMPLALADAPVSPKEADQEPSVHDEATRAPESAADPLAAKAESSEQISPVVTQDNSVAPVAESKPADEAAVAEQPAEKPAATEVPVITPSIAGAEEDNSADRQPLGGKPICDLPETIQAESAEIASLAGEEAATEEHPEDSALVDDELSPADKKKAKKSKKKEKEKEKKGKNKASKSKSKDKESKKSKSSSPEEMPPPSPPPPALPAPLEAPDSPAALETTEEPVSAKEIGAPPGPSSDTPSNAPLAVAESTSSAEQIAGKAADPAESTLSEDQQRANDTKEVVEDVSALPVAEVDDISTNGSKSKPVIECAENDIQSESPDSEAAPHSTQEKTIAELSTTSIEPTLDDTAGEAKVANELGATPEDGVALASEKGTPSDTPAAQTQDDIVSQDNPVAEEAIANEAALESEVVAATTQESAPTTGSEFADVQKLEAVVLEEAITAELETQSPVEEEALIPIQAAEPTKELTVEDIKRDEAIAEAIAEAKWQKKEFEDPKPATTEEIEETKPEEAQPDVQTEPAEIDDDTNTQDEAVLEMPTSEEAGSDDVAAAIEPEEAISEEKTDLAAVDAEKSTRLDDATESTEQVAEPAMAGQDPLPNISSNDDMTAEQESTSAEVPLVSADAVTKVDTEGDAADVVPTDEDSSPADTNELSISAGEELALYTPVKESLEGPNEQTSLDTADSTISSPSQVTSTDEELADSDSTTADDKIEAEEEDTTGITPVGDVATTEESADGDNAVSVEETADADTTVSSADDDLAAEGPTAEEVGLQADAKCGSAEDLTAEEPVAQKLAVDTPAITSELPATEEAEPTLQTTDTAVVAQNTPSEDCKAPEVEEEAASEPASKASKSKKKKKSKKSKAPTPADSFESAEPAEPAEPVAPAEPVEPAESAEPAKLATTTTPIELVEPEPVEPAVKAIDAADVHLSQEDSALSGALDADAQPAAKSEHEDLDQPVEATEKATPEVLEVIKATDDETTISTEVAVYGDVSVTWEEEEMSDAEAIETSVPAAEDVSAEAAAQSDVASIDESEEELNSTVGSATAVSSASFEGTPPATEIADDQTTDEEDIQDSDRRRDTITSAVATIVHDTVPDVERAAVGSAQETSAESHDGELSDPEADEDDDTLAAPAKDLIVEDAAANSESVVKKIVELEAQNEETIVADALPKQESTEAVEEDTLVAAGSVDTDIQLAQSERDTDTTEEIASNSEALEEVSPEMEHEVETSSYESSVADSAEENASDTESANEEVSAVEPLTAMHVADGPLLVEPASQDLDTEESDPNEPPVEQVETSIAKGPNTEESTPEEPVGSRADTDEDSTEDESMDEETSAAVAAQEEFIIQDSATAAKPEVAVIVGKPAADQPSEDELDKDEPSKDEPSEDEHSEDELSEDKPSEDEPSEDEHSEDEPSEDESPEDEPGKDELGENVALAEEAQAERTVSEEIATKELVAAEPGSKSAVSVGVVASESAPEAPAIKEGTIEQDDVEEAAVGALDNEYLATKDQDTEDDSAEDDSTEEVDAEEHVIKEVAIEEPSTKEDADEDASIDEAVNEEATIEENVVEVATIEEANIEENTTEKSVADIPVVEEATIAESVAEVATVKEAIIEESKAEEPESEKSEAEESEAEESEAEESDTEEAGFEENTTEKPVAKAPAIGEAVIEESATKQATVDEPAVEIATIEVANAKENATEEHSIEIPAFEDSAGEDASVEENTTEAPVVKEAIVDEPAVEEVASNELDTNQLIVEQTAATTPKFQEEAKQKTIIDGPVEENSADPSPIDNPVDDALIMEENVEETTNEVLKSVAHAESPIILDVTDATFENPADTVGEQQSGLETAIGVVSSEAPTESQNPMAETNDESRDLPNTTLPPPADEPTEHANNGHTHEFIDEEPSIKTSSRYDAPIIMAATATLATAGVATAAVAPERPSRNASGSRSFRERMAKAASEPPRPIADERKEVKFADTTEEMRKPREREARDRADLIRTTEEQLRKGKTDNRIICEKSSGTTQVNEDQRARETKTSKADNATSADEEYFAQEKSTAPPTASSSPISGNQVQFDMTPPKIPQSRQ